MATEKKETAQRDAQGVRKQSYKRFKEGATTNPRTQKQRRLYVMPF